MKSTPKLERTRTVTLTDRPPVRILETDWPVIARAATPWGRADTRGVYARRHADGRVLVYAVAGHLDPDSKPRRAGYLLDVPVGGPQVVQALRKAGAEVGLTPDLIALAVGSLPSEVL
jgi:hypothetical protein